MNGFVISVFAGLGKTYVGNKYSNVCDLVSSPYRYDYSGIEKNDYEKKKSDSSRIPNPLWPNNYLNAIIDARKKYDIVLVPSSLDVRELLLSNHIDFWFVLPSSDLDYREILLNRYKKRGNNNDLIIEVMSYFDNWSREQNDYSYPIFVLDKEQFLEDFLLDEKLL